MSTSLKFTILALSASENSVSQTCASSLTEMFDEEHDVELIDIRSFPPVWVDNRDLTALPDEYAALDNIIRNSDGVILAVPIYCYTMSSPAKAITELFASALSYMPVAIIVAAGSLRSHLAIADLMKSMMFEQDTICFPRTVMATSAEISDEKPGDELSGRLQKLAQDFTRFAAALKSFRREELDKQTKVGG